MRRSLVQLAIAAALLAGCGNKGATTTEASSSAAPSTQTAAGAQTTAAASMTPEQLGTLGAQIKKQPNDADRILADHGMNVQSFAAAVRKVSESPDAAKRYSAAFKSAS